MPKEKSINCLIHLKDCVSTVGHFSTDKLIYLKVQEKNINLESFPPLQNADHILGVKIRILKRANNQAKSTKKGATIPHQKQSF